MPSQVRLVLRVEIESKQGVIADSVHASGETTALALANGVELIVQTSLDPLLAAFPKKTPSAGEVEWQSLVGEPRGWSVCRGRLFAPGLPEPAFDTQELWNGLLERFLATKPSPALHTIRWRIGAGRPSDSEMLLDDQPWAAGKASLDDWALLRHSDDGAVHQFGLVGPTSRSRK